jgi:VanZ family protein
MFIVRSLYRYKISILFTLFIIGVSIYPFESDTTSSLFNIPHFDKIVHFGLYGMLAFLIFIETPSPLGKTDYMKILLLCMVLGGIVELIQVTQPERSGDIFDMLANVTGSLSAVPAYIVFKKII